MLKPVAMQSVTRQLAFVRLLNRSLQFRRITTLKTFCMPPEQVLVLSALTLSRRNLSLTTYHAAKETLHFQCPKCSYTDPKRDNVKKHVVSVHKAKPYGCPHCEEGFTNFKHLNKHIKDTHPKAKSLKDPYEKVSVSEKKSTGKGDVQSGKSKTTQRKPQKERENKTLSKSPKKSVIKLEVVKAVAEVKKKKAEVNVVEPKLTAVVEADQAKLEVDLVKPELKTVAKVKETESKLEKVKPKLKTVAKVKETESKVDNVKPKLTAVAEAKETESKADVVRQNVKAVTGVERQKSEIDAVKLQSTAVAEVEETKSELEVPVKPKTQVLKVDAAPLNLPLISDPVLKRLFPMKHDRSKNYSEHRHDVSLPLEKRDSASSQFPSHEFPKSTASEKMKRESPKEVPGLFGLLKQRVSDFVKNFK